MLQEHRKTVSHWACGRMLDWMNIGQERSTIRRGQRDALESGCYELDVRPRARGNAPQQRSDLNVQAPPHARSCKTTWIMPALLGCTHAGAIK